MPLIPIVIGAALGGAALSEGARRLYKYVAPKVNAKARAHKAEKADVAPEAA